jgi:hypothetical protein
MHVWKAFFLRENESLFQATVENSVPLEVSSKSDLFDQLSQRLQLAFGQVMNFPVAGAQVSGRYLSGCDRVFFFLCAIQSLLIDPIPTVSVT